MADKDPLEFLKQEVANEDQAIRVTAMGNLRFIAYALDKDETKRGQRIVGELVPFLQEVMGGRGLGDEELRYKIACNLRILGALIPADMIAELIPLISKLMEEEEQVVRDEALKGFHEVLKAKPDLVDKGCAEFKRLAQHEWFTGRLSAVAFLPLLFPFVTSGDEKQEILRQYTNFVNDESPMVKKAVATKLKDVFCVVPKELRDTLLLPMYTNLAQDATKDEIRTVVVDATVELTKQLKDQAEECKRVALPNLAANMEDKSWRVRLRLAKLFPQICEHVCKESITTHLLPTFCTLFGDTEQEVRVAASTAISDAVPHLSQDQLKDFLGPHLPQMAIDTCHVVRQALGKALGPLAKKLGREHTQTLLLSLVLDLFKDESQETRLAVVEQTGIICEVLGIDAVSSSSSLIPALQVLVMDNHWRIRLTVVEQTVLLAQQFGTEVFQQKLEHMVWGGIDDSVYMVRNGSVMVVQQIARQFGAEWTINHLLPKILDLNSSQSSFVMRVTVLDLMRKLGQKGGNLEPDDVLKHLVPVVQRGLKDTVPNVRALALAVLSEWMDPQHRDKQSGQLTHNGLTGELLGRSIKQNLAPLEADTDGDVQVNVYRVMKILNNSD